jgi:putative mycofactocin binding protein MftB
MTASSAEAGRVAEAGAWRLAGSVELRPEPFGALAYDFHTRRLTFLKTPTLVEVVRRLGHSPTVGAALTAAGVADANRTAYLAALENLAAGGLIEERTR